MKKSKHRIQNLFQGIGLNLILFLLVLGIGGTAFSVLRRELLKNSQQLGTSLAENCAQEQHSSLLVYETLLSFGLDYIEEQTQNGATTEELEGWMARYLRRVLHTLGTQQIDPYAVIHGRIVAAIPWEGDETYDYTKTSWYQKAIAAGGDVIYTDLYDDAIYDRPVITLAQSSQDGEVVFAFDIFPENIQFATNVLPENGSLFLCDSTGRLIYQQSNSTEHHNAREVQKYLESVLSGIEQGKYARYDSSVDDMDGNQRGVYYSRLPTGWMTVITVPFSSILESLRRLTIVGLLILAVLICVFCVLIGRDVRNSRRLRRTNEAVRGLSNSYYALYRVNYTHNTYEMIKGSDYIRSRLKPKGSYTDLLEVIGQVLDPEVCDEYMKSFSLAKIRHLAEQGIRDFGGDFLRRFGEEYRWVNVRVLFDETLSPQEVLLCFREIDEEKRRQLEEHKLLVDSLHASRQSEESKQAFFSNMSHDMRTPLNAILGLCELAERSVADPQKTTGYLEKINRSARLLLQLINEILEMSRIEQGEVLLQNQKFDLKTCVQESADLFRVQAEQEDKQFMVQIDLQTPQVMGDGFRLTQILQNLLSNAFKFTDAGDTVTLTVQQTQSRDLERVEITVADTGIGMSKEFLQKIYEPYARENRFGTRQVAGTGLGMAIIKNLVELMNGQITVESEQGKGTTFTVMLPFLAVKQEPLETCKAEKEEVSLQGRRILLAEDNAVNMEVASEILTMNGLEVVQAWNGREAVEAFRQSPLFSIDAILMDMQMPEMDGCEAARSIRNLSRADAETVPIIAVTANAFREDIALTAEAGMDAHVSKPIDFSLLAKTLEGLLQEREQS